jgi:hypothetical protein
MAATGRRAAGGAAALWAAGLDGGRMPRIGAAGLSKPRASPIAEGGGGEEGGATPAATPAARGWHIAAAASCGITAPPLPPPQDGLATMLFPFCCCRPRWRLGVPFLRKVQLGILQ